ncbi:MAG: branched-chain amino acid ABC transporter permease [Thermodesulfobacteriota bacterium]
MEPEEERVQAILAVARWLKSPAGLTILLAGLAAVLTALDQGLYVIVNTFVTGGMWGLMAMGLALVFGVMNISNFAHGEYFMLGTLAAYYIFTPLSNHLARNPNPGLTLFAPALAVAGALVVGVASGIVSDKLVFHQLRKRSREEWLMNCFLLTLGLSVIMMNGHQLLFGTTYKGITRYWELPPVSFFDVYISVDRLFASLLAVIAFVAFWLFMKFTRLGQAMRAVSQDEAGALMVGISVERIQTLAMAVSCGLAALAGGSLLFMYPSYPTVGLEPLYNSWFVIIVVGFGNVMGAIAGGFIIALLQVITRTYAGEGWEYVIPVLIIALVLIFKPNGIFGSKVRGIWEQ